MKVAYLINMYPRTSHSFIRREIAALEAGGLVVDRYSVRHPDTPLVDDGDVAEAKKTTTLLDAGAAGLMAAMTATAMRRPAAFQHALATAMRLGKRSESNRRRHLIYLAEACVLRQKLEASGATHLHVHFATNSATVALLCRHLGGPRFSFTVHGPEEFDRPERLGLGEKIAAAEFVATVSEFTRSQLYRWCAAGDWEKVHVVHCGLDEKFLNAKPTPPPSAPRFVCVGRLCEQKGQLLLLRAVKQLRDAGKAVELVFAGDGPMRSVVEKAIAEMQLTGSVRITGWLSSDQVKAELLAARVMVLPSFAEGLPVVLMESLALHRPVITTYIAGNPELVQHGVNGWLVPAGSVEALAAAMDEAVAAPVEMLSLMGRAGAARVARQHNARTEASRLATLIRRAAGDASPATATAHESPATPPAARPVMQPAAV